MPPFVTWIFRQVFVLLLWVLYLPLAMVNRLVRAGAKAGKHFRLASGIKLALAFFLALQVLEGLNYLYQRAMVSAEMENVASWSLHRAPDDVRMEVARLLVERGFGGVLKSEAEVSVTWDTEDDLPICRIEAAFPHELPLHLVPRPTFKLRLIVWKVARQKPARKPSLFWEL